MVVPDAQIHHSQHQDLSWSKLSFVYQTRFRSGVLDATQPFSHSYLEWGNHWRHVSNKNKCKFTNIFVYNCSGLHIEVRLIHFYTFLASKVNHTITQIYTTCQFNIFLVLRAILKRILVQRLCSWWPMTYKSEWIYHNFITLLQSCWWCNCEIEFLGLSWSHFQLFSEFHLISR